ncbi:MAG: hypothetical protein ACLFOY_16785 [Desulfatibacillaceae bacterium]
MFAKDSLKACAVFLLVFAAILLLNLTDEQGRADMSPGELFEDKCSKCHPLERALSKTMTEAAWKSVVYRMEDKWFSGISEEDAKIILGYLVETRSGPADGEGPEE